MPLLRSTWARAGLLVAALAAGVLVASIVTSRGEADVFPGMVEQSASATDGDVTVEVLRGSFTGTGVDIEVAARAADGGPPVAGVSPVGAEMGGVPAASTHVRRDGTALLRFPAEAWPEGVTTTSLSIRTVTVFGQGGGLEPLAGNWELVIELPEGDEAKAARAVEALVPVTVDLAGHEIAVETFLTPAATVIRYELPETGFAHIPAPTLYAGDTVVDLKVSEQRGTLAEVEYGPTRAGDVLTLAFEGVVAVEPLESPWTLELTIEPDTIPARSSDPNELRRQEVRWHVQSSTGGHPDIHGVVVQRILDDVRLVISFGGSSWRPGPTAPRVLGDNGEMKVVAAGFSVPQGVPESVVEVRLDDSGLPERLVMTAEEQEVVVPRTEVVLRP